MIPPSYFPAAPRGVLPQSPDGDVAFSFETESGPVRLRMSETGVLWMLSALLEAVVQRRMETNFQPEISPGSANCDGSPHEGQKV